jgi:hypothetical protein
VSTIKSSAEDLTINADGSNEIKFQINAVEKASINSSGLFTSTTIDATKLTGNLPAISGAALTGVGVAGITSTADANAITIDSSEIVTLESASNGVNVNITNNSGDNGSGRRKAYIGFNGKKNDGTAVIHGQIGYEHSGTGDDTLNNFYLKKTVASGLQDVFNVDNTNELTFTGGRENDAGVGGTTWRSGENAAYMSLAADATFTTNTDPFNPGCILVVSHWTNSLNLNQAVIHGDYAGGSLNEISNPSGRIVVNASTDDNICVTTSSNNSQFTITNKFDITARVSVSILRFNGI